MKRRKQMEIAKELGLPPSFFCHIINGQRRPSIKRALDLEKRSGIARMIWLYGNVTDLRREIEAVYGKINFAKGRPVKN